MLVKRDLEIIDFVNEYGGITIPQCSKIFFKNNVYAEDQARKRLKIIVNMEMLKACRVSIINHIVYYSEKIPSYVDLKVIDFYSALVAQGAEVSEFTLDKQYGDIKVDGYLSYNLDGKACNAIVIVDLKFKIELPFIEKLYNSREAHQGGIFPTVYCIARSKEVKNYNGNIDIKLIDIELKQLAV